MLLLNINRKSIYEESIGVITFDLSGPEYLVNVLP